MLSTCQQNIYKDIEAYRGEKGRGRVVYVYVEHWGGALDCCTILSLFSFRFSFPLFSSYSHIPLVRSCFFIITLLLLPCLSSAAGHSDGGQEERRRNKPKRSGVSASLAAVSACSACLLGWMGGGGEGPRCCWCCCFCGCCHHRVDGAWRAVDTQCCTCLCVGGGCCRLPGLAAVLHGGRLAVVARAECWGWRRCAAATCGGDGGGCCCCWLLVAVDACC